MRAEATVALSFGLILAVTACKSAHAYLSSLRPTPHGRYFMFANAFWSVSLILSPMSAVPGVPWIANAVDAAGSWFILVSAIYAYHPCRYRCEATEYCPRPGYECPHRLVQIAYSGVILFLFCVGVVGAATQNASGDTTMVVGDEWYDVVFALSTASFCLAAGLVMLADSQRGDGEWLVAFGLMAWSLSDYFQPLYMLETPGYGADNTVWWVEWGFALLGLVFYIWGTGRMFDAGEFFDFTGAVKNKRGRGLQ